MAKKRADGEGTYFRKSNGTWTYRLPREYDADGKIIRKTFCGTTQGECKAQADEYRDKSKKGQAIRK